MRAFIGLGNPGRRYRATRHNIGFGVLDSIQAIFKIPFEAGKGDYYFSEATFEEEKILLVKPVTYMNTSGLAVVQLMEHFPLSRKDLLLIYDDFHLPFGEMRFRAKGSSGGHNGIHSVIYHLGSEEFDRLRIGIGSPQADTVDYVLSGFTQEEQEKLPLVFKNTFAALQIYLKQGIAAAMNAFNKKPIDEIDKDN